jgi:hypothetical protein
MKETGEVEPISKEKLAKILYEDFPTNDPSTLMGLMEISPSTRHETYFAIYYWEEES